MFIFDTIILIVCKYFCKTGFLIVCPQCQKVFPINIFLQPCRICYLVLLKVEVYCWRTSSSNPHSQKSTLTTLRSWTCSESGGIELGRARTGGSAMINFDQASVPGAYWSSYGARQNAASLMRMDVYLSHHERIERILKINRVVFVVNPHKNDLKLNSLFGKLASTLNPQPTLEIVWW